MVGLLINIVFFKLFIYRMLNMEKSPHIAIEFPVSFQKDFQNLMVNEIEHEFLDLRIRRKGFDPVASLEWIVPSLVAVYIFKPYFESFLKEAGKDHYLMLKNKINDILSKTEKLKVREITSSKIVDEMNNQYTQSKAVSICIETKGKIQIKLLYDNRLDLDTWQKATTNFLNLVEDHYEGLNEGNPLTNYLNELDEIREKFVFAIIHPVSKDWTLISNVKYNEYVINEYKRKNKN